MTDNQSQLPDFLKLNEILNQVVYFASSNRYQTPEPDNLFLDSFNQKMQKTFVLYEQLRTMPGYTPKATLEELSLLYWDVYEALTVLLMGSPDPKAALSWFDYQKEFSARQKQLQNLTMLLDWQQALYTSLLDCVPLLPVPITLLETTSNKALGVESDSVTAESEDLSNNPPTMYF